MTTWNVPIFDRGDENPDDTLKGVGIVMTGWEATELELAILYSCFANIATGQGLETYGQGRIFRDRIATFTDATRAYFVSHPNQDVEGTVNTIIGNVTKASDRRNEVAHGMVLRIDKIEHFRNQIPVSLLRRKHHAVVPPLYTIRKYVDGLPSYAYRFRDMQHIASSLFTLREAISELRKNVFGIDLNSLFH